jgi:hypothetical protein
VGVVRGKEELIVSLMEADYLTARVARQIGGYVLSTDSDYYVIGGLR